IRQDHKPAWCIVVEAETAGLLDIELSAHALVIGTGLYEYTFDLGHLVEIACDLPDQLHLFLVEFFARNGGFLADRLAPRSRGTHGIWRWGLPGLFGRHPDGDEGDDRDGRGPRHDACLHKVPPTCAVRPAVDFANRTVCPNIGTRLWAAWARSEAR